MTIPTALSSSPFHALARGDIPSLNVVNHETAAFGSSSQPGIRGCHRAAESLGGVHDQGIGHLEARCRSNPRQCNGILFPQVFHI